jgi:uncharacterized protein (DUF2235 family)
LKRLALFCDGTWNDPDSDTNVFRLKTWVAGRDDHGVTQVSHYIKGVGVKAFERLSGGALGKGLSANVLEGYRWLVENYDEDDEIYLFGFSRGAYTARSIAGIIVKCGLLRRGPGVAMTPEEIFERYRSGKDARPIYTVAHEKTVGHAITPDEQHLLDNSRRVSIHMIGVWDTVGALGIPWTHAPLIGRGNFYFHNTNPSVLFKHAYQAMAIDEQRGPYKPTLWTKFTPDPRDSAPTPVPPPTATPPVIEQRWFVGAHCNVGGGYANDRLRDIPLAWIQEKASAAGLAFSQRATPSDDAYRGPYTDSYKAFMMGLFRFVSTRFFRPIGAGPRKVAGGTSTPINEWIDASVFAKVRSDPTYRPVNLVEFARLRGIDLASASGELRASPG